MHRGVVWRIRVLRIEILDHAFRVIDTCPAFITKLIKCFEVFGRVAERDLALIEKAQFSFGLLGVITVWFHSAHGQTRTDTPFRTIDFESILATVTIHMRVCFQKSFNGLYFSPWLSFPLFIQ
jgi:hypothetical protein